MEIDDIKALIASGEFRALELKKATDELKDWYAHGMRIS